MSSRECNLCQHVNLVYNAGGPHHVRLVPRPSPEFPKGMDVLVDGEFRAWYAEIPAECEC